MLQGILTPPDRALTKREVLDGVTEPHLGQVVYLQGSVSADTHHEVGWSVLLVVLLPPGTH